MAKGNLDFSHPPYHFLIIGASHIDKFERTGWPVEKADKSLDAGLSEVKRRLRDNGSDEIEETGDSVIVSSTWYDPMDRSLSEKTTTDGGDDGADLPDGNGLADEYLAHMRDDQIMQAILRFARGDTGATVVCRTSALREDLPVVGRGQVVETWSDTATAVARHWRRLGGEFTAADVADAVDVSKRQVRRVLAEFVDAGYLTHVGGGDGTAKVYSPGGTPSAGEVDLPDAGEAVAPGGGGQGASNEYYTWNVRVRPASEGVTDEKDGPAMRTPGAPPCPTVADGVEPPG